MKKTKILLLVGTLLLLSMTAFTQQPADKIVGTWESIDGEVKLKFQLYKSDDKYFGKLLYASNMYEADGKTSKRDNNNPNQSLRNRSRQGITNITNLKYNRGEYSGGSLYNPSDGRSYSLSAKLINANELHFRGYIGVSLLGRTMKFKRVQ